MNNSSTQLIKIELTQGQTTIVDAIDADLAMMRWCACYAPNYSNGAFYAMRSIWLGHRQHRNEVLHRVIMARILGRKLIRGEMVDHINGNPLDNRRSNLRLASSAENNRNRGKNSNNTSGYKGVAWHKQNKQWRANIRVNRKLIFLGYFDTAEEAARAYDSAARKHFGAFAWMNFGE